MYRSSNFCICSIIPYYLLPHFFVWLSNLHVQALIYINYKTIQESVPIGFGCYGKTTNQEELKYKKVSMKFTKNEFTQFPVTPAEHSSNRETKWKLHYTLSLSLLQGEPIVESHQAVVSNNLPPMACFTTIIYTPNFCLNKFLWEGRIGQALALHNFSARQNQAFHHVITHLPQCVSSSSYQIKFHFQEANRHSYLLHFSCRFKQEPEWWQVRQLRWFYLDY